jgi:hypothetical protein
MALVAPIRIRVQTKPKLRLRVIPRLIPLNATVEVGTTTTLPPGSPANVTNSGTDSAVILNFALPQGPQGTAGTNGTNGSNGLPGVVQSVVAGSGISVNSADPANPVVTATAGALEATIHAATSKATPVDADEFALVDSAASFGLKKLTWANLKATAKTYFDTLYQPLLATLTSWGAITRASGFDTFAATPSSANLRALLTDEVGTGAAYFVGGALGTPASGTATNLTGLPISGITGFATNMATWLAGGTSAQLAATMTDETGSGALVFATSPTLVTPILGTPTSGTLTNCTGLPVAGITSSTSTALGVGSLEVGNASDTTISRSAAGIIAVEGVPLFSNIPQNSQSAAYTLVLADAQKHILHPSADTTARIFTIPANSSVAFPIGTAVTFVNQASGGVITIAITTDTMRLAGAGTTGSRTLAANGIATALKLTATEWIISGTGLT